MGKEIITKRKLRDIWLLLKAKHYAVLIGDSEDEIGWAINALREADNVKPKR